MRLTPTEFAAVAAAQRAQPVRTYGRVRVSLAMWSREQITAAIAAGDLRPGMPVIRGQLVATVQRACARLNDHVRNSHAAGGVVAGSLASAAAVCDALDRAAAGIEVPPRRSVEAVEKRGLRVNMAIDDDELATWQQAAEAVGFTRVSAWARDVLIGLTSDRVADRPAPSGVVVVRVQAAGAAANVAQLASLAEVFDPGVADQAGRIAVRLRETAAVWLRFGAVR